MSLAISPIAEGVALNRDQAKGKLAGMNDNGHILIVDDQREICELVQEYLSGEGYRVSTAQDGAGMHKVMAQSRVDLVILDLMLPGEDGLTLARALRQESSVGII